MCWDIKLDIIIPQKKSIFSTEAKLFIKAQCDVTLSRGRLTYKSVLDLKENVMERLMVEIVECQ